MAQEIRPNGFYWLWDGTEWTIGEWHDDEWLTVLGLNSEMGPYADRDFERIGPQVKREPPHPSLLNYIRRIFKGAAL